MLQIKIYMTTITVFLILLLKPLYAQDTIYLDSTATIEERVEDIL